MLTVKEVTRPARPIVPKVRHGEAWQWTNEYNNVQPADRDALLVKHLGEVGDRVCVRAPFFCEMGTNIFLDDNVFINTNCTLLDIDLIIIGWRTLLGPGVQIYTGYHAKGSAAADDTLSKPVTIGKHCWIGGCAIILPGVTIGDGAVIGAGSVVTKNVPAQETWAGNPAKAIG